MNCDQLFRDLVHDKNVVLIGPGKTTNDNLELIESFDTVIRCGQSLPIKDIHKKHYGERTDIIYNSLDNCALSGGHVQNLISLWLQEAVKLVCNTYPRGEYFHSSTIAPYADMVREHLPVKDMADDLYFDYKQKLKCRPNSGFCAFVDVLNQSPRQLHIIGIDFFRSLCFEGYKTTMGNWKHKDFIDDMQPGPENHHDPDSQYMLFKQICESQDNISCDSQIISYFEDDINDKLVNLT